MGKRGRRFAPLLVTMFFLILAMNVTGIVPLLHMPAHGGHRRPWCWRSSPT